MRILIINADGAGFADYAEVPNGTTVAELFAQQVSNPKPDNYLIRVNRLPAARDQVLVEDDRISIPPRKIEGAGA